MADCPRSLGRDVSFRYPGAEHYAIRNVSFKILPGQLCVRQSPIVARPHFRIAISADAFVSQVIIGANGSGKSTILKLIVRLYDVEEGEIFIDGHEIRTLKLADLRQAVSVLFQDYTHFPLSVREPHPALIRIPLNGSF